MHGGGRETAAEVIRVGKVAHGDDSVGDGGTNVGAHDHEDGVANGKLVRADEGDDDGGGGGGGLHQHSGEDTDHEAGDGVVDEVEHLSRVLAAEELEAGAHQGEGKEEDPEAVHDEEEESNLLPHLVVGGPEPLGLSLGVGLLLGGHGHLAGESHAVLFVGGVGGGGGGLDILGVRDVIAIVELAILLLLEELLCCRGKEGRSETRLGVGGQNARRNILFAAPNTRYDRTIACRRS